MQPSSSASTKPALPTTLQHTLKTHTGPINALTLSALGGTFLLTGSSDRQIHLSRTTVSTDNATEPVTTTSPIQKYTAHGYAVLDIACAGDNQTFASVGGDRTVFLWDVQTALTTRRLGANTSQGHTRRVNCVRYAGDGDGVLISGSDDRSVRVWDMKSRNGSPIMVWEEARDGVSGLAVGRDGVEVVVGSVDGRVRSYDVRMGRVVVDVFGAAVTSVQLTRDGGAMLVGALDSRLRLMDRRNGTCLRVFPAEEDVDGATYRNVDFRIKSCFGVNEAVVMSGSEGDGKMRAWDVLSGEQVAVVDVSENGKVVSCVAWREGGRGRDALWAASGADGITRVFGS